VGKQQLLQKVKEKLHHIYEDKYQDSMLAEMDALITRWEKEQWGSNVPLSQQHVWLITYGDSIYEAGKPALETLHTFLTNHIGQAITDVHLLPMFPYTSDDGFSVKDYRAINPALGDWDHITALSKDYRLMFDFVANHLSKSSAWFQGYLHGDANYQGYFIPQNPAFDESQVTRPRTSPLFHEYTGKAGTKTAWTTFSEDQVDLNFRDVSVLLEMTGILLLYAFRGATSIRLDAIGFLWKESGTTCMHLPQTHAVIQLWQLLLDHLKPHTQIITETNVPHQENISYFGDGTNEANMVYQFALPPLVFYTFTVHRADKLKQWAKTVQRISDQATYFNFLASHDGIGLRPVEGILTEAEIQLLANKVEANGGRVSYRTNHDGSQSIYELNINYMDALVNKEEDTTEDLQIQKMLAAHAILLSMIGVPAIYYHSLLGSHNDIEGVEDSGINRRINRQKLEYHQLVDELKHNQHRQSIFTRLTEMIHLRQQESAFSPFAFQSVLDLGDSLFALKRENESTGEIIYLVVNVDCHAIDVETNLVGTNLVTNRQVDGRLKLGAYEFVWIKEGEEESFD
jgi:glycosidase